MDKHLLPENNAEEDRLYMSGGYSVVCEECDTELPANEISQIVFKKHPLLVCSSCKQKLKDVQERKMRMAIATLWSDLDSQNFTLNPKYIRDVEICYDTMFIEKNEDRAYGLKQAFISTYKHWDSDWY